MTQEEKKQLRQIVAWLLQEFGKDRKNRGISVFADVNGYE